MASSRTRAAITFESWPTPSTLTRITALSAPISTPARTTPAPRCRTVPILDTVLHEYAHYLDGFLYRTKNPLQPKLGMIDTTGFYAIAYDLNSGTYCHTLKSNNPMDWIANMQPSSTGMVTAPPDNPWYSRIGLNPFPVYCGSGPRLQDSGATGTAMIAQRYEWLKTNVFNGLEYDTDLPRDLESGCNDMHGTSLWRSPVTPTATITTFGTLPFHLTRIVLIPSPPHSYLRHRSMQTRRHLCCAVPLLSKGSTYLRLFP